MINPQKKCAYCGNAASETKGDDHLFARAIFRSPSQIKQIINPIKLSACDKCHNDHKSNIERYAAIVFNTAADHDLSGKLERGFSSLSRMHKDKMFSGHREWVLVNGIYQDKWFAGLDWDAIKILVEYIAIGLLSEYSGRSGIKKIYPYRLTAAMPISCEYDIAKTLQAFDIREPEHIFRDDNRYNGEVKYAVVMHKNFAIVYFQIFEGYFYKSCTKEFCRIFATAFDMNKFSCKRYLLQKSKMKEINETNRSTIRPRIIC